MKTEKTFLSNATLFCLCRLLSRFDSTEEYKVSQSWLNKSSNALKDIFLNWLPRQTEIKKYLELTKIPYIPYFSFGEKLPVIEQGTSDPAGIGYSYETISAIIANKMENIDLLLENRNTFIESARNRTQYKKQYVPKIFIACTRDDSEIAKKLYNRLLNKGYEPWLDVLNLSPGSNWKLSIRREIERSDFFLACLSPNLTNKQKYIHKEIDFALNIYRQEKKGESIYLIPVKLEDSNFDIPDNLSTLKWINLYDDNGFEILDNAIKESIKNKEMSRVIIITSNSDQYLCFRSSITRIQEGKLNSGLLYEKGFYKNGGYAWEIILCEIGSLSNSATSIINEIMRYFHPGIVFRIGFGCGLGRTRIGDLVVPTNVFTDNYEIAITDNELFNSIRTSTVSIEQRARLESKKGNWLKRIRTNGKNINKKEKPRVIFGPSIITPIK